MTSVLIADDQALVRVGLRKILEAEPGDHRRRRGRRRRGRRHPGGPPAARRRADGYPHAGAGRDRGHPAHRRRAGRHPGAYPDHLRPRHLRLRRAPGRRQRLHAQGRPPEEIAAAVRIVASGEGLPAPAITRAVIEEFAKRSPAPPSTPPRAVEELTAREPEILELLVRGLSNPEICQQLVISEATAKTHVAHILQKLHLRDRVQAVVYAYETGLVAPGSTH